MHDRRDPVRGHARRESGTGEVRAQPLAGLKLRGVNQRLAAGPAPPRKPRQRAFRLVEKYSAYRIVARAFTRNDPFVLHQKRIAFREQPREMRFARRGQRDRSALARHKVVADELREAAR